MPESCPGRLAYKPVDGMMSRIDLASVQRGWPDSLDEPGAPVEAAPIDPGTLLAGADPETGIQTAKISTSCHDYGSGGPRREGQIIKPCEGQAEAPLIQPQRTTARV